MSINKLNLGKHTLIVDVNRMEYVGNIKGIVDTPEFGMMLEFEDDEDEDIKYIRITKIVSLTNVDSEYE